MEATTCREAGEKFGFPVVNFGSLSDFRGGAEFTKVYVEGVGRKWERSQKVFAREKMGD